MKFLLVSPRFHTNLYYRVKALKNEGHDVYIAVLYKGKSEYHKDVNIHLLKPSTITKIVYFFASIFNKRTIKSRLEYRLQTPGCDLRKTIKTFKPDFIILKAFQNMLALKTIFLAKYFNVKVLMLTQTNINHIKNSKRLFKLNINLFNKLNVYSYITPIIINETVFKNIGIKNIHYVPFVFDKNSTINEKSNETIKIITIGKFIPRKQHLILVEAIKILRKKYKLELTIIGEIALKEYYERLINYLKINNLNDIVKVKENIIYSEVMNEYVLSDIFVLPAYGEPAAYSPVEALSHGLPVIISSDSGTNCYIKDNYNGFIFEAKNVNDLVDKIEILLSNPNKLAKISKNALISAKENHSLKSFSDKIHEIIKFS